MKTKPRIRNTKAHDNIFSHCLGVSLGEAPDILGEERRGGQMMVAADQLPIKGFMLGTGRERQFETIFAEAGGKINDRSKDDPLFVDVTLPPGWTKKATGHDMWTDLLDANGNKRAGIFYKAAFYDRSAHLSPCARLHVTTTSPDPTKSYRDQPCIPVIMAGGSAVWSGAPIPTDPKKSWESSDQAREIAVAMLTKFYPDYEKLDAYWDVKEFKFE